MADRPPDFDRFFANVDVHIERLDDNCIWIGIFSAGQLIHVRCMAESPVLVVVQPEPLPTHPLPMRRKRLGLPILNWPRRG